MTTPDLPPVASRTDAPVAAADRYASLDVLRGIAVLMIFSVNIRNMLGPMGTMFDPAYFTGPNDLVIDRWLQYAVDGKWIATFAILFGAGLTLLAEKARAAGTEPKDRIVPRQSWLLAFGLVHLLLIWPGDVLTAYAIVGFVAMVFLERRGLTIGLWAFGLLGLTVLLFWGIGAAIQFLPAEFQTTASAELASALAEEEEALRGGIADQLAWRIPYGVMAIFNVPFGGVPILGYMLIGILLYRNGFLLARWRAPAYLGIAAVFLAGAWMLDYLRIESSGIWDDSATEPYATVFFKTLWVGFLDGLLGAVGYAAVVNFLVRIGLKAKPLAAAGRMAFTNYIACSLVGTTVAYGHAGGKLGEVTLQDAMILVGITWLGILIVSPLWLSVFRYGPLEWIWRSLSYRQIQPFRR